MAASLPPDAGWYPDPLGLAGMRWWNGSTWVGPAVVPAPVGRRLPGWAKTCFAVGIGLAGASCALVTAVLPLILFFGGPHSFDRVAKLWIVLVAALVIAAVAAAIRGGVRMRLSALAVAVALMASGWVWYEVTLPRPPRPTLAELANSPAGQLIYPRATVATNATRGRNGYVQDDRPYPAVLTRDEATNDTQQQVVTWFDQQLTTTGWTRHDAAAPSGNTDYAQTWSWTRQKQTFTLSIYTSTGRDSLYNQAPQLSSYALAFDTYLN